MNKTKALEIIKQTIDACLSSGMIKDLETASSISYAYQYILQELNKSKQNENNSQSS